LKDIGTLKLEANNNVNYKTVNHDIMCKNVLSLITNGALVKK